MIQTPSGPTYGKIEGLASPDEGMIDMETGETQYLGSKNMNVKDVRKDIIPVGMFGRFDSGTGFDERVAILGHRFKDQYGFTPADYSRPFFKRNEQIKDAKTVVDAQREQNNSHPTRDKNTR